MRRIDPVVAMLVESAAEAARRIAAAAQSAGQDADRYRHELLAEELIRALNDAQTATPQ